MASEGLLVTISEKIGLSLVELTQILCFLLPIPLGHFQLHFIHNSTLRHLFSIICGLSLAYFQLEEVGITSFFIASAVPYLLLLLFPHKALPAIIFSFFYLFYIHIYNMTSLKMIWNPMTVRIHIHLACKITLLAFSYEDAKTLKKNPKKVQENQKVNVVNKLPNLLEYFSYLWFYPSILNGPNLEYSVYIKFVNKQNEFKSIPFNIYSFTTSLTEGFFSILIGKLLHQNVPHSFLYTEDFLAKNFFYKFIYYNASMISLRLIITAEWKFSESSLISCGCAYTQDNSGNFSWSRGANIRWTKVEFGPTVEEMLGGWNLHMGYWLKKCVYDRVIYYSNSSDSPSIYISALARATTCFFSATLGGFYIPYFFWELSKVICMENSRKVYSFEWTRKNEVFRRAEWFFNRTVLNSFMISFYLQKFEFMTAFMSSVFYFPVFVLIFYSTLVRIATNNFKAIKTD